MSLALAALASSQTIETVCAGLPLSDVFGARSLPRNTLKLPNTWVCADSAPIPPTLRGAPGARRERNPGRITRRRGFAASQEDQRMKLYHVRSIVDQTYSCKNVPFHWFLWERSEPRPYHEMIENYDPKSAFMAEGAIDELFTEAQATALKWYLDRVQGSMCVTTIDETRLPIPRDMWEIGALPVGGTDHFLMLFKQEAYDLPFKVAGYFNLAGCERLDVRWPTLLSSSGTTRLQNNTEELSSLQGFLQQYWSGPAGENTMSTQDDVEPAPCRDCGRDVIELGHPCVLETSVWRATGLARWNGCLCLDHIEARLGRPLCRQDFQRCTEAERADWGGDVRKTPERSSLRQPAPQEPVRIPSLAEVVHVHHYGHDRFILPNEVITDILGGRVGLAPGCFQIYEYIPPGCVMEPCGRCAPPDGCWECVSDMSFFDVDDAIEWLETEYTVNDDPTNVVYWEGYQSIPDSQMPEALRRLRGKAVGDGTKSHN